MEKSPLNKKSLEIKSYHFETLFSRLFSSPRMILYKSPFKMENARKQKGLDIKTPVGILDMQMHRRKVGFMKASKT